MKSMNQKAQAGFTLIELMIVVAIIGILAAVAIPQYSNYTTKAKMANAVTAADSLKAAVGLCIQENGGVADSCDAGSSGVPTFAATKEVKSATVTDGVIVLSFADDLAADLKDKTVTFTPVIKETSVGWNVQTTVTNTTFAEALTKNSTALAADTTPAPSGG